MKNPRATGTPVDAKRIRKWTEEFAGYRHPVSKTGIESWLTQFGSDDQDLAARVLDAVDFYGPQQIAAGFRASLQGLEGWSSNPATRKGRWRFVAYSGSAGESGDTMLHQFRLANNLNGKVHKEMFIYRSELTQQKLGPDDSVVLLDDLTATGDQVCDVWNEHFAELVAGVGRIYLMVVVAGKGAQKRIRDETELELVPMREMKSKDSFFSTECKCFSATEKNRLLGYAVKANNGTPKGYGDCGYLLVFQHRCPNNSIPILHESHSKWEGLFPRND